MLAINLEPTQRTSALPLLAAMRVGFVPLESDWAWAEKEYGADGTPYNVLIDAHGRIVFRPNVHDNPTRMILDRQVEALLNRTAPGK